MPDTRKGSRYPGYDVLSKRLAPSWNEKTRQVIDARLAVPRTPRFFTEAEFATVIAIAARLVPQRDDQSRVPVAALVDQKLHTGRSDGYRHVGMPREREAWQLGRARAAMCGWAMTSAIRGRRPRSRRATWPRRKGRNAMSDDPMQTIRTTGGRAPDVFKPDGRIPMREYREDEAVDFIVVGTGAGGGPLACRLAEEGFSVVAFDAGPYFRPLQDFASDESEQTKLYWTDDRIVDGDNPLQMGSNNSGKAVGGSTVHFAMVSLRFRPDWFKARSKMGYGADWPLDWREMWKYYGQAEQALKIAGPITYPWGRAARAIPIARMR